MHRIVLGILAACAVGAAAAARLPECPVRIEPPQLEPATRDGSAYRTIYGWQLMTRQERAGFLARWRSAPTAAERAELQRRHRQAMDARARERGVRLPGTEAPPTGDAATPPSSTNRCVD